jgi:hypothetical protein
MGQTELFYYRYNGTTYETPAYALSSPFTTMFNAIRGLAISDPIDLSTGTGPVIAALQMGSQPDQITLNILELQDSTYVTRGSITKFDNNSSYKGVFVQISPDAKYLCVTSHNNYTLYVEFFKWDNDVSTWNSVREFQFSRNTTDFTFTYIYLSEFDSSNDLPYRFFITGVNSLAQDTIYGIYGYDGINDKFIQLLSLSQKLHDLVNSLEPKVRFNEPAISSDWRAIWKSFVKTDGTTIMPMNYDVYPEFDIQVDNVNSAGVAGMIFTDGNEGLVLNVGHYVTPGPYIFDITASHEFQQYVIKNHLQVIRYGIFIQNTDYEVHPTTGVVTIFGGTYGEQGFVNNHYNGIYVQTKSSPFWVDLKVSWKIPKVKPAPTPVPEVSLWQRFKNFLRNNIVFVVMSVVIIFILVVALIVGFIIVYVN